MYIIFLKSILVKSVPIFPFLFHALQGGIMPVAQAAILGQHMIFLRI